MGHAIREISVFCGLVRLKQHRNVFIVTLRTQADICLSVRPPGFVEHLKGSEWMG